MLRLLSSVAREGFVRLRILAVPRYVVALGDEHPSDEELRSDRVFVVREGTLKKWAYLRCPCGCREVIQLSLNPSRRPRWEVREDWFLRPTLHPSVNRLDGCRSHFWVRSGAVEWCD